MATKYGDPTSRRKQVVAAESEAEHHGYVQNGNPGN